MGFVIEILGALTHIKSSNGCLRDQHAPNISENLAFSQAFSRAPQ
jgi:hypothetical protein